MKRKEEQMVSRRGEFIGGHRHGKSLPGNKDEYSETAAESFPLCPLAAAHRPTADCSPVLQDPTGRGSESCSRYGIAWITQGSLHDLLLYCPTSWIKKLFLRFSGVTVISAISPFLTQHSMVVMRGA